MYLACFIDLRLLKLLFTLQMLGIQGLYCGKLSPSIFLLLPALIFLFEFSRNGKSFRLSRDHKPSDDDEAKRIVESGGFIGRSNRVNGVLSVSRALGDHMFKPYVSPVPHITATRVNSEDLFIILACDGVSVNLQRKSREHG